MKSKSALGMLPLLTALCLVPAELYAGAMHSQDTARHRLHGVDLPDQNKIIGLSNEQRDQLDRLSTAASAKGGSCDDVNQAAQAAGSPSQLADYIANLPMVECTYSLFGISNALAQVIYSPANVIGLANRLETDAPAYDGTGTSHANLILYLRAGYFNVSSNIIPDFGTDARNTSIAAIQALLANPQLTTHNTTTPSTFYESLILIVNVGVENTFVSSMNDFVTRFTNTAGNSNAVDGITQNNSVSRGYTGVLTVFFFAHSRHDNGPVRNPAYPQSLYAFFQANHAALEAADMQFHAQDTLREAFRFMTHSETFATVRPMVMQVLADYDFTIAAEAPYWIEAANAVEFYDNANCADYGICDARGQVEAFVLDDRYNCTADIRMIAQDVTQDQADGACTLLEFEDNLFHGGMKTNRIPVEDDFNDMLEVVVFDDYDNYDLYASYLYNVSTDNGGIYLEGDPSDVDNQARFLAHEAFWLRPEFRIWNLEHEFIHYLDGRYNLKGDFGDSIQERTVWWIEGLAEYYSLQNGNQDAIDIGQNQTYPLSEIFQNTYQSTPFLERVYRWGYLAVRFMFENHRDDVDTIVGFFRVGDYAGYAAFIQSIGTSYDAEFNDWLLTVTTGGPFAGGGTEDPDLMFRSGFESP